MSVFLLVRRRCGANSWDSRLIKKFRGVVRTYKGRDSTPTFEKRPAIQRKAIASVPTETFSLSEDRMGASRFVARPESRLVF